MKRSSFLKRLFGLAATAVVAPQILTEEIPDTVKQYPLTKEQAWMPYEQYKDRVEVIGIPARPNQIWIDSNGKSWYVPKIENNVITMSLIGNHMRKDGEIVKQIHPPYDELKYMVCMCSAIPEGSQI